MSPRKLLGIATVAGITTIGLGAWVQGASGGAPTPADSQARYLPIQSISHEFGSKSLSGYFVKQDASCVVTLMIAEKSDPEEPPSLSPTRVRIVLYAGQVAGLDSEEGRSLNLTCGEGAATLTVDGGERDKLVALQDRALRDTIAQGQ